MKLDVATAKPAAAVRRHGLPVRELTVLVAEYLQCAAILFLSVGDALVAARGRDDGATGRHDADLVRIDARVERRGLGHFSANRAVGRQAMHGNAARLVERGKHVLAALIDGDVDRPIAQTNGITDRLQCSGRVYLERVQVMVPRLSRRVCVAGRNVEKPSPRIRFLHLLGKHDGIADFDEGSGIVRDSVAHQLGTDVRVEIRSRGCLLRYESTETAERRGSRPRS